MKIENDVQVNIKYPISPQKKKVILGARISISCTMTNMELEAKSMALVLISKIKNQFDGFQFRFSIRALT